MLLSTEAKEDKMDWTWDIYTVLVMFLDTKTKEEKWTRRGLFLQAT
jgi:hypothetical protein